MSVDRDGVFRIDFACERLATAPGNGASVFRAGRLVRRPFLPRGSDDRGFLPADVSGAEAVGQECGLLPDRAGGIGCGIPSVQTVPAVGTGRSATLGGRSTSRGGARPFVAHHGWGPEG